MKKSRASHPAGTGSGAKPQTTPVSYHPYPPGSPGLVQLQPPSNNGARRPALTARQRRVLLLLLREFSVSDSQARSILGTTTQEDRLVSLMTTVEATSLLGCSKNSIKKRFRRGQLSRVTRNTGEVLWYRHEIENLVARTSRQGRSRASGLQLRCSQPGIGKEAAASASKGKFR